MRNPIVGIDLGTTFSAVATVTDGRPVIIPSRLGGRLTPSMVGFTPEGDRVVGPAAFGLSEEHPELVAYATKRYIGRRWSQQLADDARGVVPYSLAEGSAGEIRVVLGSSTLPLTQVSAMVLGELKLDAQTYFGRDVSKCVITVPANFDDAQRQATREAARIAGLEVVRIVNEPTAAAVAYGLQSGFRGRSLVFDLGGGTFDVSILDLQDGVFEVKATGGDGHLGGEDFDNRIVQWLLAQVTEPYREAATRDRLSMQRLKVAAERAKRQLTEVDEAMITVDGIGDNVAKHTTALETVLTRSFFETLSDPLSRRCLKVCEQVMKDAGLSVAELDSVLLVGGMTRVPLVRKLVKDFFQKDPITGVNPDEAVALGAAIHANEIGAKEGAALLLDVVSQSLGVGTVAGKVKKLIPKNTVVPVSATEGFFPGQYGQKEARIRVYQGESEYADENRLLGEVLLKELPAGDRKDAPLDVTFELNGEGMLAVRVTNLVTGKAEAINVRARTELSPDEVKSLAADQAEYTRLQESKDMDKLHAFFTRLLEKAEKLARMLDVSLQENPSAEAKAAVANVRTLVDSGKAALKVRDNEAMAEVTRKLTTLLQGATA